MQQFNRKQVEGIKGGVGGIISMFHQIKSNRFTTFVFIMREMAIVNLETVAGI
jgi:hypothetical protein